MLNTERGVAQVFVLFLLVAGLGVGLVLSQQPQIFGPKAFEPKEIKRERITVPTSTPRSIPRLPLPTGTPCTDDSQCRESQFCFKGGGRCQASCLPNGGPCTIPRECVGVCEESGPGPEIRSSPLPSPR